MAYQRTNWQDHVVDPVTGQVVQQGTKVSATRLNNMEKGIEDTHNLLATTPHHTTTGLTYYVDAATGNDANAGTSSATALKSIQAAINKLPRIVDHSVVIVVAAGSYPESVFLSGRYGEGSISLTGASSLADTHMVKSVSVISSTVYVYIGGFKATATDTYGFYASSSIDVTFDYCKVDAVASGYPGIKVRKSNCKIANCSVSSRGNAIHASDCSTVFSTTNTGSGNSYGLYADDASTIGKFGLQPAGATAEYVIGGGEIR